LNLRELILSIFLWTKEVLEIALLAFVVRNQ